MNIKPQFSSSEVVFKISVKNNNSHSTVHEFNREEKENEQPIKPGQNKQAQQNIIPQTSQGGL